MRFSQSNSYASTSFYNSNILKFIDIIYAEICLFTNNCLDKYFFRIFLKINFYAQIPILAVTDP